MVWMRLGSVAETLHWCQTSHSNRMMIALINPSPLITASLEPEVQVN